MTDEKERVVCGYCDRVLGPHPSVTTIGSTFKHYFLNHTPEGRWLSRRLRLGGSGVVDQ